MTEIATVNVIKDVSSLTKVPTKAINALVSKEILCIGSAIHNALINDEPAVVLNIGLGDLSVELSTKKCKFIPSKELSATIRKSIDDDVDPIEFALDQAIIDKLLQLCDEAI